MDSRKITDPLNRGMVGGLLGMPADMLNMLRNGGRSIGNLANRLAGVNAPPATMVENPVYGQEWWGDKMQQAGYVSPNRNKLAEFGAGLLDPGSVMTDVPMLAKGLFGLGDPATTKMLGGLLGATVWHGSPHKFDKFDSSKIGTGEGNQAYGHGLYLAESPDVAKDYQEKLTDPAFKYVGMNEAKMRINEKIAKRVEKTDPERAAALRAEVASLGEPGGSIYKVDLPDDAIAKMLDWDKPLSQQSPEVQRAIKEFGELVGDADWQHAMKTDDKGSWFYRLMEDVHKNSPRGASVDNAKFLRDSGIPGIRYLDGDSRGTGAGTSNFVVFPGEDGLLKILERNGKPLK